jgi:hypothetical protein
MATPISGLPAVNNMIFPNEHLGSYAQHCFTSQKHTVGVQKCYPYLEPGVNSSTVDAVTTTNYGLDYDFFYRSRFLPYDLGATEVLDFDFFTFLPGVTRKN